MAWERVTYLKDLSKGVEEPPMRVDLFLIFLLEAKDQLYRHDALLRALDFHRRCHRNCWHMRWDADERGIGLTLCSVFVDMGCDGLTVDDILDET